MTGAFYERWVCRSAPHHRTQWMIMCMRHISASTLQPNMEKKKSDFFFLPNKIAKIWTVKNCMYLYILYLYIFSHQNRHQGKFKAELIVPTYYRLIMSPYLNVIRSMLPWLHHCCTDSFGLAGGSTCSCSRPDLVKASSQWPLFYRWCRPFTSSARCD